jgi:hypothetical protein
VWGSRVDELYCLFDETESRYIYSSLTAGVGEMMANVSVAWIARYSSKKISARARGQAGRHGFIIQTKGEIIRSKIIIIIIKKRHHRMDPANGW